MSIENIFSEPSHKRRTRDDAVEEFITIVAQRKEIVAVLERHGYSGPAGKAKLADIYKEMLLNGAGLWLGRIYVLAAALYDPELLARLLNAEAGGIAGLIRVRMAFDHVESGYDYATIRDAAAAYGRRDYATALRLWRPLAGRGYIDAQFILGFMYDNGQGVPQDYAEALNWYRKAAARGHATAQLGLGFLYTNGRGVQRDYVQAHKWLNLAAARFSSSQTSDHDAAVMHCSVITAKMTPAEIAEARRLACEWKPD